MASAALATVASPTTGHLTGHEESAGSPTVGRLHPPRIASALHSRRLSNHGSLSRQEPTEAANYANRPLKSLKTRELLSRESQVRILQGAPKTLIYAPTTETTFHDFSGFGIGFGTGLEPSCAWCRGTAHPGQHQTPRAIMNYWTMRPRCANARLLSLVVTFVNPNAAAVHWTCCR